MKLSGPLLLLILWPQMWLVATVATFESHNLQFWLQLVLHLLLTAFRECWTKSKQSMCLLIVKEYFRNTSGTARGINLKLSEHVEQHLKLKTNRNYSVDERGCPLLNASLFTLKFFIMLKSRVVRKSKTLASLRH